MLEQRQRKRAHNPFDDLPENFIFDILVRLPIETLCSSRFVCKSWYDIISSPAFSYAHLRRSETTTRGFIFLTPIRRNDSSPPKKVFSVESNSMLVDPQLSKHIQLMEIKKQDGTRTTKEYDTTFMGEIVATCNGLIVLKNYPSGTRLIILNPVTRELEDIPSGTNLSSQRSLYGLAFCHASRRYKLLHLFWKEDKVTNLSCEIMDVGSGSWRAVDGPPAETNFSFLQNPTFALGALHWVQFVDDDDDDECMVSMPLDDEKFKTMAIPDAGEDDYYFKLVFAMGEFLGFSGVLVSSSDQFGVWVLRGLGGEYGWEKQYNIDIGTGLGIYVTSILCYVGGVDGYSFVFKGWDGCLYANDDGHVRKIVDKESVADTNSSWRMFPHVNSLVTWRRS